MSWCLVSTVKHMCFMVSWLVASTYNSEIAVCCSQTTHKEVKVHRPGQWWIAYA